MIGEMVDCGRKQEKFACVPVCPWLMIREILDWYMRCWLSWATPTHHTWIMAFAIVKYTFEPKTGWFGGIWRPLARWEWHLEPSPFPSSGFCCGDLVRGDSNKNSISKRSVHMIHQQNNTAHEDAVNAQRVDAAETDGRQSSRSRGCSSGTRRAAQRNPCHCLGYSHGRDSTHTRTHTVPVFHRVASMLGLCSARRHLVGKNNTQTGETVSGKSRITHKMCRIYSQGLGQSRCWHFRHTVAGRCAYAVCVCVQILAWQCCQRACGMTVSVGSKTRRVTACLTDWGLVAPPACTLAFSSMLILAFGSGLCIEDQARLGVMRALPSKCPRRRDSQSREHENAGC